jgi:hypothetical protein
MTLELKKRALVCSLIGLILLIAGSYIAVDWVIFRFGIEVAFNFVWIFYGTTILCLALSGYRWLPGNSSTSRSG